MPLPQLEPSGRAFKRWDLEGGLEVLKGFPLREMVNPWQPPVLFFFQVTGYRFCSIPTLLTMVHCLAKGPRATRPSDLEDFNQMNPSSPHSLFLQASAADSHKVFSSCLDLHFLSSRSSECSRDASISMGHCLGTPQHQSMELLNLKLIQFPRERVSGMGKCPDLTTSSDDKRGAGPLSQPSVAQFTVWVAAKLLAASSLVNQELNCGQEGSGLRAQTGKGSSLLVEVSVSPLPTPASSPPLLSAQFSQYSPG